MSPSATLTLAKGLHLPLDAVSRTFGILAVRGAGKSNTAAVMAEEMFAAGLPFVVIDPVGSWYGLRSSSDGQRPGLPVPIFGGKHGDIPLERGAGELVADLVVEKRLTCVLDLSRFDTESDKKAFLLAFARRLYQRNEHPLHLFLEEADDYIPQSPMGDEKHLLRAWENIVRRGRARGLGMTIITQRSAAVAKMVLTQVETLFAMRTTGPQDIAAIEAWVKYHQVGRDVLSTLAGLEDGEAWVWSPHYLKTMARHQIRRRRTFDSGATPGNVRVQDTRPAATLADIDVPALQERMAATIERAKADDPKALRARIAALERQLATPPTPVAPTVIERPVLTADQLTALTALLGRLETVTLDLSKSVQAPVVALCEAFQGVATAIGAARAPQPPAPAAHPVTRPQPAPIPMRRSPGQTEHGITLGKAERAVLTVLAQHPDGCDRGKLTLLAGYRYSGGFRNSLSALRSAGYLEGGNEQTMRITAAGRQALGPVDPLPTGADLQAYWLSHPLTGKAERAILQTLFRAPAGLTAAELCQRTGYEFSGGFRNSLSNLRTAGLLEGKNTERMRAAAVLLER